MSKIISFPHLGDYYIPIKIFLEKTTNLKVKEAPPITKKTLELGNKYSPSTVCIPFKYNLGNFIESLNNGANILFTAGGGCRYRYYAEVTEKILRDLNYDFEFIKLISKDNLNIKEIYKIFKKLNPNLTLYNFLHTALYTFNFIWNTDKIDKKIRKNIGFEINKNEHIKLKTKMIKEYQNTNSIIKINLLYFKYKYLFFKIKKNIPKNCLKVGLIGELYTSMEPYSNYYLEKTLASYNIQLKRFTNLSYLLWQKRFLKKFLLWRTRKYCKYNLGADGLDNVYRTLNLINKKYDGIIHTKPFGCTPEIGAIPIIQKICNENNMPILFFSYDVETSNEGIKTRLEAFNDLLHARREKND